jgi:hypothetical protein
MAVVVLMDRRGSMVPEPLGVLGASIVRRRGAMAMHFDRLLGAVEPALDRWMHVMRHPVALADIRRLIIRVT